MSCGQDDSPPYLSFARGPYSSSIASSASSSSAASVWSDASSQTSDDSQSTLDSDPPTEESCTTSRPAPTLPATTGRPPLSITTYWPKHKFAPIPEEQRQHPRRASLSRGPPSLVRQCDRKVNFVDSLVDSSAQIVETIWPLSSVPCRSEIGKQGVLPLRTFIQETLRRSRTSYSTLQVALYYLILIKPHVPKHDFTMEQPEDVPATRALQCGRRMFLAALILASKYLQDRNYSARAWSKISGLNVMEINQNEMAFLLAVNWRIHITDAVFQRWTEIVLKYTPSLPPSPGSPTSPMMAESADWRSIILRLNPELDNIEGVAPVMCAPASVPMSAASPRSFAPPTVDRSSFGYGSNESTPTQKYYTPNVMEPSPTTLYPASKPAPALGLLPTPRLTPQSAGFTTPAVSAASYMLSKPAMGFAMAQASSACQAQMTERWQTPPPSCYSRLRRSSLANSVSSMSSPESMVSDTSSRSSRSSSISSASSLMSAPLASKLDVQARCRYAKLCSEMKNRPVIATVPEAYTSSPDSYTGPVGKDFLGLCLDTPIKTEAGDYFSKDEEAARALQELHNTPRDSPTRSAKRARTDSVGVENCLQENVRHLLHGQHQSDAAWSDDLVRARIQVSPTQVALRSSNSKRVCCASEASGALSHPAFGGIGGPGMWRGILN